MLTPKEIFDILQYDAIDLILGGDQETPELVKKYGINKITVVPQGFEFEISEPISTHKMSYILNRETFQYNSAIFINPDWDKRICCLMEMVYHYMKHLPQWFFDSVELRSIPSWSKLNHSVLAENTSIKDFSDSLDQVLSARNYFIENTWDCVYDCSLDDCCLDSNLTSVKHGITLTRYMSPYGFEYTSDTLSPELVANLNQKHHVYLTGLKYLFEQIPTEAMLLADIPFNSLITISDNLNDNLNFFDFLDLENAQTETTNWTYNSDQGGRGAWKTADEVQYITERSKRLELETTCKCEMQVLLASGCQCQRK